MTARIPSYFSWKALALLAEFRFGDFRVLATIAGGKEFRKARSYLDIEARLPHMAGSRKPGDARVRSAECHVESQSRETEGSFMAARMFWEEAIQAFQNRPSLRERIPELQRRLAVAGKKTLDEMKAVSHEFDIRELVEAAENKSGGFPLPMPFAGSACFFS